MGAGHSFRVRASNAGGDSSNTTTRAAIIGNGTIQLAVNNTGDLTDAGTNLRERQMNRIFMWDARAATMGG